jgi:Fe-S oxidoreductase
MCRFSCPVAKVTCSEASTPTGKMTILKLARAGAIEFNAEVAELMYQCSGCILSRTYCEHRIEVIGAFEAARSIAVEKGIAAKRVMEFGQVWNKFGNPYGNNLAQKLKELSLGRRLDKKPVMVFAGCTMTHYFPETIKDFVKVLDKLGLDYELFAGDRICCGYPLYATGHWQIFEEHKKYMAEKLSGYETIIAPCPTCAYFLKAFYQQPALAEIKQILHITEFLNPRLGEIKLKSKVSKKVVYHDPCHLGRYLGVYDAPRNILNVVTEKGFLEFYEHGDQAGCCGGGGGLPLAHPGIARGISKTKLDEFKEMGGEILATSCPMCERMFTRTGREQGVIVQDLVSLMAQNLG